MNRGKIKEYKELKQSINLRNLDINLGNGPMSDSIEGIWTIQRILEPILAHTITFLKVFNSSKKYKIITLLKCERRKKKWSNNE
jgi:hypothetical protein